MIPTTFPYLSLAIWLPIAFGVLILWIGNDRKAATVRTLALAGSVLGFLVTLPLATNFSRMTAQIQFVERAPLI